MADSGKKERTPEQQAKRWENRFKKLKAYHEENGDWPGKDDTCSGKEGKEVKIGMWATRQRKAKKGKKGKSLTDDQIEKLDGIGFPWKGKGKKKKKDGDESESSSSNDSSSGSGSE